MDLPHRQQKDGGTAFVTSADVVGPFIEGHDLGNGARKVRYALAATIPAPLGTDVSSAEEASELLEDRPVEGGPRGAVDSCRR